MRNKVSGIRKEIEKILEEKDISIEELSKKSCISISLLESFINLEKEPYMLPEMDRIVNALELSKEEKIKLIEKWKILNSSL